MRLAHTREGRDPLPPVFAHVRHTPPFLHSSNCRESVPHRSGRACPTRRWRSVCPATCTPETPECRSLAHSGAKSHPFR